MNMCVRVCVVPVCTHSKKYTHEASPRLIQCARVVHVQVHMTYIHVSCICTLLHVVFDVTGYM